MDSKGVEGESAGVDGKAACEGAFLLQTSHVARVLWMSTVIPGQNTIARARNSIEKVP